MTPLRILRILILIPANIFFLLLGIIVHFFLFSQKERLARAKAFCTMYWSRAMCCIMGIRVSVSGSSCGFQGEFTVSNHLSYLDIFAIGSMGPSSFLSKHEVRSWPLVGWLASLGGTIFINRESKKATFAVMKEIRDKINCGVNVVLFPEGTTSDGRKIRKFKSSLFDVPAKMKMSVVPLSVRYTHIAEKPINDDMIDKIAWHGGAILAPHFWNLLGYRSIDAVLHFNPPISGPDAEQGGLSNAEVRKKMCSAAYESVTSGFMKIER